MDIESLACTLTGPELVERIHEWRAVAARATSRTVKDNTVVTTYPRDPGLLDELYRLIEAEMDCCSFMDFQVEESAEDTVVHLQVPEDMKHVLALMIGITTDETELAVEST